MDPATQVSICFCWIGGCFAIVYFFFALLSFLRSANILNPAYSIMLKLALLSMSCITFHFFASGFETTYRNFEKEHPDDVVLTQTILESASFVSHFTLNTAFIFAYCTFFLRIKMWSKQTSSPISTVFIFKFYVIVFLTWMVSISQWIVTYFVIDGVDGIVSVDLQLMVLCWSEALLRSIVSLMLVNALLSRINEDPQPLLADGRSFRSSLLEDISIESRSASGRCGGGGDAGMTNQSTVKTVTLTHPMDGITENQEMQHSSYIQLDLSQMQHTESTTNRNGAEKDEDDKYELESMKREMVRIWVLLLWCIVSTAVYAVIFLAFITVNGRIEGEGAFYASKVMVRVMTGWIYCVCMRLLFPFSEMAYGLCCGGLHGRCFRCLLKRKQTHFPQHQQLIIDIGKYTTLQPESLQTK